jgi:outer membrane protein assembly factor BamB
MLDLSGAAGSQPPETPNAKPRRGALIALVAGIAAVAVVVIGGIWLMSTRDKNQNDDGAIRPASPGANQACPAAEPGWDPGQGALPDLVSQPTLGQAYSTTGIVGGTELTTDLEGYLDETTGLAGGSATSAQSEPFAVLDAFDIASGERKWRVDLGELFDAELIEDYTPQIEAYPDGGRVVVWIAQQPLPGVAVLDCTGAVLSMNQNVESVVTVRNGMVLTLSNNHQQMAGFSIDDLTEPVWETKAGGTSFNLFNPGTGTWWTRTAAGYVDAYTGIPVGPGLTYEGVYSLVEGDSDVFLETQRGKFEDLQRVDPETGEPMWDSSVSVGDSGEDRRVVASTLMIVGVGDDHYDVGAFDIETGTELWRKTAVESVDFFGDAVITLAGTTARVLNSATGEERAAGDIGPEESWIPGVSSQLLYVHREAEDTLAALDWTGDEITELWSVDLSPLLDYGEDLRTVRFRVQHAGDRLLAVRGIKVALQSRDNPADGDVMVEVQP